MRNRHKPSNFKQKEQLRSMLSGATIAPNVAKDDLFLLSMLYCEEYYLTILGSTTEKSAVHPNPPRYTP